MSKVEDYTKMIAEYGFGWFGSIEQCSDEFKQVKLVVELQKEAVERSFTRSYLLFYREIYPQTKEITKKLKEFRQN
jgi:xylulokinase